nr:MAK10-like protein [Tanacetum cinerariifolium]
MEITGPSPIVPFLIVNALALIVFSPMVQNLVMIPVLLILVIYFFSSFFSSQDTSAVSYQDQSGSSHEGLLRIKASVQMQKSGEEDIRTTKETEPLWKVSLTEEVLVNPAYPDQLVTIGKNLSPEGSTQLKAPIKKNMIFLHGNHQT